jgi:hypothetical protein
MKRVLAAVTGVIVVVAAIAGIATFVLAQTHHSLFPEPAVPTATLVPTATPHPATYSPPQGATLFLQDPLKDDSQGHGWDTAHDAGGSCAFARGGYQVSAPKDKGDVCSYYAPPLPPDNLAIEVTATLVSGFDANDSGVALAFRSDPNTGAQYEFGWDANGPSNANVIAVEVQGSHIRLFVNGYLYGEVTDRTYTHGLIGFVVGASSNGPDAVAVFSDLTIWQLP